MTLDDFLQALENDRAPFRDHRLGAPLQDAELRQWQARHPRVELPAALLALLRRTNGIHPCAADDGLGQLGLAPLHEWTVLDGKWLLLTYDLDGRDGMAFELGTGQYVDFDLAARRPYEPWGSDVSELLEWLWSHGVNPLPQRQGSGSGLFYAGTQEEVRLGDQVRIRRSAGADAEGVVSYIPGFGPRHPDLEIGGMHHWAVTLADGAVLQQLYAPERLQPKDDLLFVARGETESLPPAHRLR